MGVLNIHIRQCTSFCFASNLLHEFVFEVLGYILTNWILLAKLYIRILLINPFVRNIPVFYPDAFN